MLRICRTARKACWPRSWSNWISRCSGDALAGRVVVGTSAAWTCPALVWDAAVVLLRLLLEVQPAATIKATMTRPARPERERISPPSWVCKPAGRGILGGAGSGSLLSMRDLEVAHHIADFVEVHPPGCVRSGSSVCSGRPCHERQPVRPAT
jgi:hypothetical protein